MLISINETYKNQTKPGQESIGHAAQCSLLRHPLPKRTCGLEHCGERETQLYDLHFFLKRFLQLPAWNFLYLYSGATAPQGLGRQSGRRRSAKLVPTIADREVSRGQRNGSPRPLISVYRTWIATYFIQVAPQLTSRGRVYPVPDPLPLRKSGSAGNRTRDLCICSQELWTLDHRGGPFLYLCRLEIFCFDVMVMISIQKMHFPLWLVQEAPYFIPSDYVAKELPLTAIYMSSPEMLILVSF